MCERYVIPDQREVEAEFAVSQPWWKFGACFNASLARHVPVIRRHDGTTEGVMMRWGLIPSWAEGEPTADPAINAHREKLQSQDHFKGPWLHGQRCILPAAGFYLWQLTPQRYRQPYFVRRVARPVFGIAAIWDRSVTDDDDVIESCSLITVPANSLLAEIDHSKRRMPAILSREDYEAWLTTSPANASDLLRPAPSELFLTYPVSPRVNAPQFDDALLIAPVA